MGASVDNTAKSVETGARTSLDATTAVVLGVNGLATETVVVEVIKTPPDSIIASLLNIGMGPTVLI